MEKIFKGLLVGLYPDNMVNDTTDMPQDQSTVGCTKSVPCIEMPLILEQSSDQPLMSDKTFGAEVVGNQEVDKPTKTLSKVKALIVHNNKLIQEKQRNAKANNYEIKKKSFNTACKNLAQSYDNCVNMKGDMDRVDDVNTFVKNHVLESYEATTTEVVENQSPQIDPEFLSSVDFDIKTGMPELDQTVNDMGIRFWQNIMLVVEANQMYYQCLAQIVDTRQFKNLKDVMAHVALTLKKGEESELIGPELIAICREHLEKFGVALDNKLNGRPAENQLLAYQKKLDLLENELMENKRSMKVAENHITLLKKEKKDLLNIINSYDTVDINKTSLEKRLKAEQKKNDELQGIIASTFKKQMHGYNSENEY